MRHDPRYRKITVDEFLNIDFGTDRKFELVDGVIQMMTGGTPAHSRVSSNILVWLGTRLRGTGCRAYNSDIGVREFASIDTIVFADPEDELTRVVQRLGPTSWRDDLFAQPHDVALPSLDLVIPHTEIFARD